VLTGSLTTNAIVNVSSAGTRCTDVAAAANGLAQAIAARVRGAKLAPVRSPIRVADSVLEIPLLLYSSGDVKRDPARALRSVADRLLNVACAMLTNRTPFNPLLAVQKRCLLNGGEPPPQRPAARPVVEDGDAKATTALLHFDQVSLKPFKVGNAQGLKFLNKTSNFPPRAASSVYPPRSSSEISSLGARHETHRLRRGAQLASVAPAAWLCGCPRALG